MIISHKINDQIVQTPFEDHFTHCYDVIVVGLGTAGAISRGPFESYWNCECL